MCRIFGFRSVIQSQVHSSLVSADNALAVQSQENPDGWGLAYYLADAPHLIKSTSSAIDDYIFQRVSGIVASETVLAHVRKATVGSVNTLNCHPFQYGRWVFAHNGNVPQIERVREVIFKAIDSNLRRFILGDTDSELIFYLFLTCLARTTDLHRKGTAVNEVVSALRETVKQVFDAVGETTEEDPLKLTILATDGHTMTSFRWGTSLYYSTYKSRCMDRDICPHLSPECEAKSETGYVNHLIISSEPLQGDNTWIEMVDGEVIGVDWRMRLHQEKMDHLTQR